MAPVDQADRSPARPAWLATIIRRISSAKPRREQFSVDFWKNVSLAGSKPAFLLLFFSFSLSTFSFPLPRTRHSQRENLVSALAEVTVAVTMRGDDDRMIRDSLQRRLPKSWFVTPCVWCIRRWNQIGAKGECRWRSSEEWRAQIGGRAKGKELVHPFVGMKARCEAHKFRAFAAFRGARLARVTMRGVSRTIAMSGDAARPAGRGGELHSWQLQSRASRPRNGKSLGESPTWHTRRRPQRERRKRDSREPPPEWSVSIKSRPTKALYRGYRDGERRTRRKFAFCLANANAFPYFLSRPRAAARAAAGTRIKERTEGASL